MISNVATLLAAAPFVALAAASLITLAFLIRQHFGWAHPLMQPCVIVVALVALMVVQPWT